MNRASEVRKAVFLVFTAGFLFASGSLPVCAFVPGGTQDPTLIPKYSDELPIPPAMPRSGILVEPKKGIIDYYEIAVRQFEHQILPPPYNSTTVFGYGSVNHPGSFSYPGYTIEARVNRPARVKWINGLVDAEGDFIPHFLPIDQTLHWANPPRECIDGMPGTDCRGMSQMPYQGPVPMVTHLHGAHVGPKSDGYPEAWYLPAGSFEDYAPTGRMYDTELPTEPGSAVFEYPNDQRATTLWYHDHSLGMTRINVYSGMAGFYLLRGGPDDLPAALLPSPAPGRADPPGLSYREIPLVIQDRSFNIGGSLFYPDNRAFFEGLEPAQLQIPFIPETFGSDNPMVMSDVSPIWNPEFFGNTMVVNGKAWPRLNVEKSRYRLRLLNGSDSRFLILKIVAGDPAVRPGVSAVPFWQIGADGGFLPAPVALNELLIAPAERADVIVDFSGLAPGMELYLINEGPDEPFGGGRAPEAFDFADPATTGQVMKLVVTTQSSVDQSLPPSRLPLPPLNRLGDPTNIRRLSLNEDMSMTVNVSTDTDGNIVLDPNGEPFGPTSARLGILDADGVPVAKTWMEAVTENPQVNDIEIWEIYNFTADAHPIHLHLVQFEVVNRQGLATDAEGISVPPAQLVDGTVTAPEPWETGTKDTVIAYPGMVTRVKAKFDRPGLYVWHCHILSHEDNEMMRPYCVGIPGIDCPEEVFQDPMPGM